MSSPTFSLPPCPACSSLAVQERPFWRYAHNTSRARGRSCYTLTGCAHAAEVSAPSKIRDDPEEWAIVEGAWGDLAERLLAERTARWTEAERARFQAALADRAESAPKEEPSNLTPEEPAQEQHEPHEKA